MFVGVTFLGSGLGLGLVCVVWAVCVVCVVGCTFVLSFSAESPPLMTHVIMNTSAARFRVGRWILGMGRMMAMKEAVAAMTARTTSRSSMMRLSARWAVSERPRPVFGPGSADNLADIMREVPAYLPGRG